MNDHGRCLFSNLPGGIFNIFFIDTGYLGHPGQGKVLKVFRKKAETCYILPDMAFIIETILNNIIKPAVNQGSICSRLDWQIIIRLIGKG